MGPPVGCHDVRVTPGAARKGGARRAARPQRSFPTRTVLLLALAVTLCVVAWGYLVNAAIDFGTAARGGEGAAWWFLALACLGAAACLFAGLMLGSRLASALGLAAPREPRAHRTPGGRRAAR